MASSSLPVNTGVMFLGGLVNHSSIEKIKNDIQKHCLDYTNTYHVIWPDEIGSELHSRKNALNYRLSSVQWHLSQLSTIENQIKSEFKAFDIHEDKIDIALKYHQLSSYYFDDIVFNIISLLDYLAALLSLIFTNNKSKRFKWNQLIKSFNNTNFDFPITTRLMLEKHKECINKLAAYRSGVYHETADSSSVILGDTPTILMPARAQKALPFYDKNETISLNDGAKILVENTLNILIVIISSCMQEKHNKKINKD